MSREGQHVARLAVKGDTKSGVAELDKLVHAQAKQEAQTAKNNAVLGKFATEQDQATAAAKRAQLAQQQMVAAQRASAQLTADTARREREALQARGDVTARTLKAHLAAIEREKAARLSQIDLERRTARTTADSFRLANQADQVRHEAYMRRRQAERAVQQQSSAGAQLGGMAGFAAGAAAAAVAADQLAKRSMQLANVQANLPFSIEKARAATKGLVSDYDLMRQAIAANRLGVAKTGEDFARVAEISTKLGVSLGQDATQSLDDLVNGLGRASTEVLDNMGITMRAEDAHKIFAARIGKTVGELSDLEKRQAVVTIGLERGAEAASKVTLEVDGMAGAWARAKVHIENATDAIINFGDNARGLAREGLLAIGLTGEQATRSLDRMGDAIKTGFLDAFTGGAWSAVNAGIDGVAELSGEVEELATVTERGMPSWTFLGHFLSQQGTAAEKAAAGWRELGDAVQRVSDEQAEQNAAKWDRVGAAAARSFDLFKAGALDEFREREKKRLEEQAKASAKARDATREAIRAELQLSIAGAQRELQVAEARNAKIGERLALIDAVAAAERQLAEEEFQWAKTGAEQLQAVASLQASLHAQQMARQQALLELEQRARAEHNARVQAEGDSELAALRRSHELKAANTGLGRSRVLGLMDPERAEGAAASFEITRLQEQAAANNELREAERTLLEQRLAGSTEWAERVQIQDQIAQLAHEAELERISVISAVEQKQLEEERARGAQRLETQRHFAQTTLDLAKSATTASMGIFRASRAAGEAAKAAGEDVARARAKAAGEGLISFAQGMRGQAVGLGFEAAADLIMGNPIGAARHAGAAAMYAAGSVAVMQIGRSLAGGGGSSAGGASAPAGFGGGGSSGASGSGFRSGDGAQSPIPPSPQPGSLPHHLGQPQPGNPAGGAAQPPPRIDRGDGTKVIHATFHAVSIDRAAAREIRRSLRDLAANEG